MNLRKISQLIIATALFASGTSTWAERVEIRGIGNVPFEDSVFSGEKEFNAAKQKAIQEAKKNAWKNFIAKQNSALQQVISKNESSFFNSLDDFIIDVVVIDASKDQVNKTVKVIARIVFNDEPISRLSQKLSVGESGQAGKSSGSTFSFIFMARSQAQIKQFDARRTEVRKATAASTVDADGAVTAEAMTQSGGNTLMKADEVVYTATSNQDLNTAMGEILSSSAGIEYVEYDDVVSNCNGIAQKSFQNEYATSDEMSSKTRAAIISALRQCDIRYFSTGTIDTLMPTRDPVTGGLQIYVTARAQLWDISGKLPRKIGSVGPKQFSAVGAKTEIAGKNALVLAAKETAKALVDQLNSKGIR